VGGVCDPAICCKRNEGLGYCGRIGNLDSEKAPLICSSLLQTDANVPQNISPAANNQDLEPAAALDISTPTPRWRRLAMLLPRGSRSLATAGGRQRFFVYRMATRPDRASSGTRHPLLRSRPDLSHNPPARPPAAIASVVMPSAVKTRSSRDLGRSNDRE